jgi:hypothetical protein
MGERKPIGREASTTTKPTYPPSRTWGLKRGGSPGRRKGIPNRATQEIKELAAALTTGDARYLAALRARLRAGKADRLEVLLWQYQFGKPKDVEASSDRPPIIFVSRVGKPGEFDPLATQPPKALTHTVAAGAEQPATENQHGAAQVDEDEDELVGRVRDLNPRGKRGAERAFVPPMLSTRGGGGRGR